VVDAKVRRGVEEVVATMISEVYDALKDAGASEEKARKAAEVLASYDDKFKRIDLEFAEIRSTLRLHSWMLAYIITVLTGIALKLLLV
jgi:hypothetical protein